MTEPEFKIDYKTGDVEPVQLSYFDSRMKEMGIGPANIGFEVALPNPDTGMPDESMGKVTRMRFSQDADGNIVIPYYSLIGTKAEYKKANQKWGIPFERIRYKIPRIGKDGKEEKYHSSFGSHNFIYFTPEILQKYWSSTTIRTLYLTEGEFKATVACLHGLDVVATSGIHNWYDPNGNKKLHYDLIELMVRCKVERLVFLTDADTLTIKYRPGKEMTERPYLFYSAVKNFREAAINYMDTHSESKLTDVMFAHLKTELAKSEAKGLDDLLIKQAMQREHIIKDLREVPMSKHYFTAFNISDGLSKIKEYFGLTTVEKFYEVYQLFLEDREFLYHKLTYRYSDEAGKLERIRHQEIPNYMRIGCDWFKLVRVPNAHQEEEEEIKKWKVSEIQRDYGKKYPNFLEDVPKYDAWCNMPAMNGQYKRNHNNCFNMFNPMRHEPKEGTLEATERFMKHLFGGQGSFEHSIIGDPFSVAMDYLTLMYREPTQILPVLCLVSPENNTGKSTFLKWLRDIYGSNATIIDNERFKQSFNSHYITKYIIGIDEGFLDVDKRSEKERLKKLATDERQYLEFKGADVQEIPFYGKIIICSNDADSLMKIDEGEIRWFVIRVPKFSTPEDPEFRNKLRAEIPAWLHYLSTRQLTHPKEGRAWFNPEYLVTEQLKLIIEKTRNRTDKVVDECLIDMFTTYKVSRIDIDLKKLVEIINKEGYSKYKLDVQDVKNYLKDKRKMKPSAHPMRVKFPIGYVAGYDPEAPQPTISGDPVQLNRDYTARCYQFYVEDWVPDHQELGIALDEKRNRGVKPVVTEPEDEPF